jgi:predicted secreted protein
MTRNSKLMTVSIIIVVYAILVVIPSVSLTQLSICPVGCDYTSLQLAINESITVSSIIAYNQNFEEDMVIDKIVEIHGKITNGERPILVPQNNSAVTILKDGVVLSGFRFSCNQNLLNTNYGRDCKVLIVNSSDNSFYLNDFENSNTVKSRGSNSWNSRKTINYQYNSKIYSGYLGNYWGDYSGSDENHDGIGDEPKIIEANNIDYHPLIMPSESYLIKGEKMEIENVINAKLNQPFTIQLDSNPTTGYTWTVDFDSHFLNKTDESYSQSEPRMIGSGGSQVFTFVPIKSGTTVVSAVYKRSWENIAADTRKFSVSISK